MRYSFYSWLILGAGVAVASVAFGAEQGKGSRMGDSAYAHLTPDEVALRGYETNYEEIAAAYGGPMSRAPVISVKAHPEIVWVRPDMGIGMVANPFAFALGLQEPSPIPWRSVSRSLYRGYLPIVTSTAEHGGIRYEQEAYATLVDATEVQTGHEKQMVVVRMSVVNNDPTETKRVGWWAFVPAVVETTDERSYYFWSYELFEVTGSLPAVGPALKETDDVLRDGSTTLGVHEEGPGVTVVRYKNALSFEAELLPGQKKYIVLKVSTNKKGLSESELAVARKLDYQSGLDARAIELEATLAKGTRIEVPEEAVSNIYKAQILYNQTQMVQAADRDYYMPVHSSWGIWPWEQSLQLIGLDKLGYHEDVKKSLDYFLQLQGTRQAPRGDITSIEGAFTGTDRFEKSGWERDSDSTIYGWLSTQREGRFFPHWTNNTGAILTALAEHYFYSRDRAWLESVAPAIIKACEWIIKERKQTMQMTADGGKPLHYGLMPAGESDDGDEDKPTYSLFTNGYTYQGLQRAADALNDIGHAQGKRLLNEAALYRADIVEMLRRTRRTDPNASPFPVFVYQPDDWTIFNTGPLALVYTGLLDPNDNSFLAAERFLIRHAGQGVLGLLGYVPDEITRAEDDRTFYMVTGQDPFHYALTVRQEVEKALLVFYSTLAFGVDQETLGAVERFDLYDRRFAPFYVNSSGGMRIASMIRRTVLFENQGRLTILPVAPRRWLEAGKKIVVEGAVTYFGSVDFEIQSRTAAGQILVDLRMRIDRPDRLKDIKLRIPHPAHKAIRAVSVNGSLSEAFDPASETITLSPGPSAYKVTVTY